MKILITGANGFLGKNLISKLDKYNFKTLIVVRKIKNYPKNFKIIKSDIGNINKKNLKIIKNFKPEIVINLAWNGIPDFSLKNSLNNFLTHCKFINQICNIKSVKKIIMTGSCWEYHPNKGKCKETDNITPLNAFTWSKINLFNYLKHQAKIKKINFIWFRIFFMYGKYQKKQSLIPHIISSLKKRKKPRIMEPNNKNDFIYVDDVCEAIISSIKKKNINGIFNLGSGKLTSVLEIYTVILKNLGITSNKYKISKIKEKKELYNFADTKKLFNELKFKPKNNIYFGISKTLNFKT